MRYFWRLSYFFLLLTHLGSAQLTYPSNGAPNRVHTVYAFINAQLCVDATHFIPNGKLIVQDGLVLASGATADIPAGAIIIDLKGKYIYPSFIDLYSNYGISNVQWDHKQTPGPQMESSQRGAYGWNMAIRSNVQAHTLFHHEADQADDYRKAGFGAVVSASRDGIVRGSAAVVLLNSSKKENESILVERAAGLYSFDKGSSPQDYPSSLTGAIALLRQSFYDARWYADNKSKTETNISLDELNRLQTLPSIFDANDKYQVLRVAALAKEFKLPFIVKAGGNEYQRLQDIRQSGLRLIVPLDFPEALDLEDPYDAENVSLSELKHWELAPANPKFLEQAGVSFAFTCADLKDRTTLLKQVRKAVQYGLSEKMALEALTTIPASYLGLQTKIGALNKGMIANFIILSNSMFDDDAQVLENWSAGQRYVYADAQAIDVRGIYELQINNKKHELVLSGDVYKPKAYILVDTLKKNLNFSVKGNQLAFTYVSDTLTVYRATGLFHDAQKSAGGKVQLLDGTWTTFNMRYLQPPDSTEKKQTKKKSAPTVGEITYPFTAFGQSVPTSTASFTDAFNKARRNYGGILIRNVTVWTNESQGILKGQDVLVVGDKISKIGSSLTAPADFKVIDGTGKHLSAGIIDEHSHIALSGGVNESAEASTAEVRMGDVINPEDINIYRQLSGGVVASQLLHGSANPIGGQSALIKLRWGMGAEDLKIVGADGFIKFALGENVKQTNWGDLNVVRFPQSRMGVEQVYYDFFTRARDYDRAMKATVKGVPSSVRRDLELEALAEILNAKRFITCHSYVQSEINMLLHVADTFGFKMNTFTHILEGYKVADKMKAHGVYASTFSDWWAYKNEVMEAIPYNAAILTRMGVTTAINSDDAEMARRLNQEAAKSVKYGALTEEEALKLVTLNPAMMLHLDKTMGSVKPGKSADLVLWSDHPLSVYAKAEITMIEGLIYFDRSQETQLRADVQTERARLLSKMLAEKQKGMPVLKPRIKQQQLYHCNTIEGVSELETGQR
jgi:imidazolonepropionase-like amidohydrolase